MNSTTLIYYAYSLKAFIETGKYPVQLSVQDGEMYYTLHHHLPHFDIFKFNAINTCWGHFFNYSHNTQ